MTLYSYKAIKDGKEYEGQREALDKQALYKDVRAEGGTILSTTEGKIKGGGVKISFSFLKKVKPEEKITFARNLAVMLEAGISLSRALIIMQKQAKDKALGSVLTSIQNLVDSGQALSEAMKAHPKVFSDLFVMMVRAGEESGKIVGALRTVANQLERSYLLTKKVKGAMIYPAIVITIMIILGIVLLVFMVPTLTETFIGLGIELPLPTRMIIAASNFLRENALILLAGIIALGTGLSYYAKRPIGKRFYDKLVLHIPVITPIVKEVNAARTARTLSSLVSSGVDIVVAISVTKDVIQNSLYKKVLADAEETIQKGGTISSVLSAASDLYPVYVSEMAAVGEETGELSGMLENIANFYESEVDQKTKDLSTIIEPVLMVMIGIGVGIFAIAMLMPTYSLVDAIQ